MVDSLVYDDKSNLGKFVLVELGDGLIELRHFFLEDLLTLSVSNSIPVDDEVRWHLTRVLALEDFDGFLQRVPHPGLHDLLALFLHNILAVIL